MKHTLNELYNMKHRQEKALQDNEYDIVRAEKRLERAQQERKEIEQGLADTIELIKREEANGK
jgi:hypothetical protein